MRIELIREESSAYQLQQEENEPEVEEKIDRMTWEKWQRSLFAVLKI